MLSTFDILWKQKAKPTASWKLLAYSPFEWTLCFFIKRRRVDERTDVEIIYVYIFEIVKNRLCCMSHHHNGRSKFCMNFRPDDEILGQLENAFDLSPSAEWIKSRKYWDTFWQKNDNFHKLFIAFNLTLTRVAADKKAQQQKYWKYRSQSKKHSRSQILGTQTNKLDSNKMYCLFSSG